MTEGSLCRAIVQGKAAISKAIKEPQDSPIAPASSRRAYLSSADSVATGSGSRVVFKVS